MNKSISAREWVGFYLRKDVWTSPAGTYLTFGYESSDWPMLRQFVFKFGGNRFLLSERASVLTNCFLSSPVQDHWKWPSIISKNCLASKDFAHPTVCSSSKTHVNAWLISSVPIEAVLFANWHSWSTTWCKTKFKTFYTRQLIWSFLI